MHGYEKILGSFYSFCGTEHNLYLKINLCGIGWFIIDQNYWLLQRDIKKQSQKDPSYWMLNHICGTLRSWGHLSFHYNLVKTGPMLRIFWLKNIFSDLPKYIECKFKWNWNTYITFVIRFVCFFAIFVWKSCPAEPTPKHKIPPNWIMTDETGQTWMIE